ncbi:MAG: class I SAM-dependent methyltransferase [Rhodothermales bacterium]
MQLKYPDTALIGILVLAFSSAATGFWLWIGPAATIPLLILLLIIVAGLQLHLFRVREQHDVHQLRQIQALISLYQMIPFKAPPPWLTGWAATPELALTLYQLVRERRPAVVVELGSGASSVIIASALEQNGSGRLICIEQDAAYADETRKALRREGIEGRVEVIHAPISMSAIGGNDWRWYERKSLPDFSAIDLLVVDGPNRELQKMARYPALPVLHEFLAEEAVIVLDDANRKDERAVVKRWMAEFEGFTAQFLNSPKGTAVIRRIHSE